MVFRFNVPKKPEAVDFQGYNLAEIYEKSELTIMGDEIMRCYDRDCEDSRPRHDAMKNYLEIYQQKEGVFKSASGITRVYPILTMAVNEFSAAASAVFPYERPVSCEPRDDIPTIEKAKLDILSAVGGEAPENIEDLAKQAVDKARLDKQILEENAEASLAVLNYQFSEENAEWVDEALAGFGILAIKGCFLRKVGFDPVEHKPTTEYVDPCEVSVSKGAKNAASAERVSVCTEYSHGETAGKVKDKIFVAFDIFASDEEQKEDDIDKRFKIVETVGFADLDGDGYAEPCVFFTDAESRQCVRIEKNFYESDVVAVDGVVVKIVPKARFILYNFLPDYEGGFFGRGLGDVLCNPSKVLSGLIGVTMDAAVRATRGGGLIDSAIGISGELEVGVYTKAKKLDGNLASALAPFPLPEPSQAMIQLIDLYQNKIAALANIAGFDPAEIPPNMPATNMAMIAHKSMEKFSAVFRSYLRAFTKEIDAFVKCNSEYFLAEKYEALISVTATKESFSDKDIRFVPAIDVRALTKNDKMMLVNYLNEKAQDPFFDPIKVRREALLGFNVRDPESYIAVPVPPPPPPPDPLVQAQVAVYQGQAGVFGEQAKKLAAETYRITEKTDDEIISLQAKSIKDLAEAEAKEVGLESANYEFQRLRSLDASAVQTNHQTGEMNVEQEPNGIDGGAMGGLQDLEGGGDAGGGVVGGQLNEN